MNPNQLINQIINNNQLMQNPMVKNAYDLMQKNDIKGLRQMADNVCKEKGIDINQIKKNLGM